MSSTENGSVGVLGLLGVLFIGLKLTGHIDWSWLWVLCPFWIGIAVCALIGVAYLLTLCIESVFEGRWG